MSIALHKIVAVWSVGWMVTWPAMLADFQGRFPQLACANYRQDLGFAMLVGSVPPAWIFVTFITGFYEHGFQVFPLERCK